MLVRFLRFKEQTMISLRHVGILLLLGLPAWAVAQPLDEKYRQLRIGNTTQYGYSSYYYYPKQDTLLANSGVNEYTLCYQSLKKGGMEQGKARCTHRLLDAEGRITEEWASGKDGKVKNRVGYSYNSLGFVTEAIYTKKPGRQDIIRYSFNDSGRLTGFVVLHNGKVDEMKKVEYQNGTRFIQSFTYGKDTTKPRYHMKSFYMDDTGKLVRTELWTGKGKLRHSWDYTCDLQGELVKAEQKKASRICKSNIVLANGHRQMIYEEKDIHELRRYIYEYDSSNRIVLMITYGGKTGETLKGRTELNYSDQGSEETSTYWKENGQISAKYVYRRNLLRQNVYSLSNYYNNKGKLTASWQTEYTYNGALLTRSNGTSLLKPGSGSITSYSYSYKDRSGKE